MQQGHLLEQIIAKFSSRFFMKDFVILNPKYERSGNQRELADLLLVLDDSCIVVSVKGTDGKFKSKTKLKNWLAKKTLEGLRQAKGGINWLSKVQFSGKDLWGEVREFPRNSLNPLCGIVLLECSQQPFRTVEFTAQIPQATVPLHFLSLNDFLNVVHWLSSIWDVFNYFSKRADIRQMFTGINQERPVVAFYTLRSMDLTGILAADKKELEKLRDFHQLHLLENLPQYDERQKSAAHVNAIVHALHTRDPEMNDYCPVDLRVGVEPLERRSSYLKMAAMLNGLPMSNKVWIGKELEGYLVALRNSGRAGCFAFQRLQSELIFVFACFSKLSRTERIRKAHEMLPAALYQYKVSEGLVIAFDADNSDTGYDLIWVRNYTDFTELDRKLGAFLFPESTDTLVADPFGNARPYRTE